MLKRNEIIKFCGTYYRVLAVRINEALLIDCQKRKMPHWQPNPDEYDTATITELYQQTGIKPEDISSVSVERQNIAYQRFSMIAGILAVIIDKHSYTKLLDEIADQNKVSKQTLP